MKKELAILFAIFVFLAPAHAGESVVSIEGGATITPNAEIKELFGLALKSLGGNAEVEFNEGFNLGVNYVYYPESLTSSQWVGFGLDYLFYFQTLKDVTVNGVSLPIIADNVRMMGFDLIPVVEIRYPNPDGLEPYIGGGAGLDTLFVFDRVPGVRGSTVGGYFSLAYEAYSGIRYNFENFALGIRYRFRATGGLDTPGQNAEIKTEDFIHHDISLSLSF